MARTGSRVVLNLSGADKMKHVEPGDFIAHLRSFQGGLETSQIHGKVSTAYTVMRALDGAQSHYFRWVFKSRAFIGELASTTQQLRDGQTVRFEDICSLRLPLPPEPEQRRIADFLDDRVARIDNIIAARQRQAALASTMPWRKFDEAIKETDLPQAPFRRFIRFISDGPFGSAFSSADYTDNGAAVIRLGNIGFAKFHGEDVARIPSHIYSQFPRCQVQPGELLIASLGDENNHAGRACIAPTGLGPAMVKGKCYRAITNSNIATAEFVQICLSSGTGRAALAKAGTGATRNMVNLDRLQSTRLPLPPLEQQRDFAENFREHERDTGRLTQSLTRFIKLLTEYKQSLITAAVTGQLDVTTASTRIPE